MTKEETKLIEAGKAFDGIINTGIEMIEKFSGNQVPKDRPTVEDLVKLAIEFGRQNK